MTTETKTFQDVNTADRRIETDFRILDTERRDRHDRTKEWATLRVITFHSRERRGYVTRVRRVMANGLGGFRANFSLMSTEADPAPIESTPTARYSLAKMEELHDAYLSQHLGAGTQMETALAWARKAVEA